MKIIGDSDGKLKIVGKKDLNHLMKWAIHIFYFPILKNSFLTPIKFHAGDRKKVLWKLRCSCGKIIIKDILKVHNGEIKSCGCVDKKISSGTKNMLKMLAVSSVIQNEKSH